MIVERMLAEQDLPDHVRDLAMGIFAALFAATEPLPLWTIKEKLTVPEGVFRAALAALADILQQQTPLFLQEVNGALILKTRPEFADYVRVLSDPARRFPKLSDEALETAAVIAFYQPAKKAQIDQARGVDCEKTLGMLVRTGDVKGVMAEDEPGRPVYYEVTDRFLERFGLKTMGELLQIVAQTVGQ